MDRKTIYNKLSTVAKVRQLSNREDVVKEPTLILMKKSLSVSANTELAGFQYWDVICYVPAKSLIALDDLIVKVEQALKELEVELTFSRTPEFYDDVLKAYMVTVEFRTIKSSI